MPGIDRFACISVAVRDQDEALRWFTDKLGFRKHTDLPETDVEGAVLFTDDCRATYDQLNERGVTFTEPPRERPFGLQAVFLDLYGNSYALVEPGTRN